MQSFVQVIDLWETAADLGAVCGVDAGTVRAWKARKSIPSAYWPAIVSSKEGKAAKVTADRLTSLVKPRKRREAA